MAHRKADVIRVLLCDGSGIELNLFVGIDCRWRDQSEHLLISHVDGLTRRPNDHVSGKRSYDFGPYNYVVELHEINRFHTYCVFMYVLFNVDE